MRKPQPRAPATFRHGMLTAPTCHICAYEQNTYAARGDTDWQTFLSIDALRDWMDTTLATGRSRYLLGGGTQNILR